jgi:hypothetical protein
MALITSAASGNFNAGATWTGGVVPGIGDEARASNGHTITITANATCDEVSNAGTGIFTLNDGVTLTANVTNKSTTTSRDCVQFTAASPAVGYISGNCTAGTVSGARAAINTGTGQLNITGILSGGAATSATAATNNSTGSLIITTGTSTAGSGQDSYAFRNVSTGTVTVTGNVTGGSGVNQAYGGVNSSTGTIAITGNVTGGSTATSHGVINLSTGVINIIGSAVGGTFSTANGASNSSTGTIFLKRAKGSAYGPGNTSGLAASVGAANTGLGVIEIEELEFGEFGMSPTSGTGIRLKKLSSNVAVFNYADTAGAKTLVDATTGQMPAATDVRDGVSYASGALVGSCKVPAAASTAFGVPVDNTTGTAALTPAAVWEYATREITGGVVDTLTNAPASVTPSDIWSHSARTLTSASAPSAADIRTEMDTNSTKLANLDATISSRLASASYTAPANSDISAIKAKTDALPSDPADQSLLEAAIAGVTAPSASTVATAVRTELATELARVDAAISTRLADADYVAPANSDITAIKSKTDALNTDRLAQVSTVSTTGAQLAAALS